MELSFQQGSIRWFVIKNNEILLLTHDNTLPDDSDIASVKTDFLRQFELGNVNNTQQLWMNR